MKISQKGLYALEAMIMLARHYRQGAVKIREIAVEEHLPEKFLEIILIELKNARLVESTRGARGGYHLRRCPADIRISDIVRVIDGPLSPFSDAEQLRGLMERDAPHRALYKVFLDVRDAAANILDNTTVSDIAGLTVPSDAVKQGRKPRTAEENAAPRNGRSDGDRRGHILTLTGR